MARPAPGQLRDILKVQEEHGRALAALGNEVGRFGFLVVEDRLDGLSDPSLPDGLIPGVYRHACFQHDSHGSPSA
jgi:hypothetical protein